MSDRRQRNARTAATITSLIPIIGGNISQGILQRDLSRRQAEQAAKINPIDPTYTVSEFAKEQLANARALVNARMPGAGQMQEAAFRNQANAAQGVQRAASNPQQMMAAAGALQQNTDNALNRLALQEAQYTNQMFGNLNNAFAVMRDEEAKVYNDQLRKFNRDFELKQNLLNSSEQNFSGSIANASAAMNSAVNFVGNLFGVGILGGGGGTPGINSRAIDAARGGVGTISAAPSLGSFGGVPMPGSQAMSMPAFQMPTMANLNRR